MTGRPFTEEQNKWIRHNYRKYGKHHITEAFNEKFNDSRTLDTMWCKVRRMGLTGNGAEYKAQMCKKHFSVPMGSEHIDKQGYTLVKVSDDKNGRSKNWKLKQIIIWEEVHGPIPDGYSVMFLDGDKTNFDINNLVCVPTGVLATLNKKKWRSSEKEVTRAGVLWCELYSMYGEIKDCITIVGG